MSVIIRFNRKCGRAVYTFRSNDSLFIFDATLLLWTHLFSPFQIFFIVPPTDGVRCDDDEVYGCIIVFPQTSIFSRPVITSPVRPTPLIDWQKTKRHFVLRFLVTKTTMSTEMYTGEPHMKYVAIRKRFPAVLYRQKRAVHQLISPPVPAFEKTQISSTLDDLFVFH